MKFEKLKFEIWNLKLKFGSWKLEVEVIGSWKLKMEVGGWKLEVEVTRSWKLEMEVIESWKLKIEVGKWKLEGEVTGSWSCKLEVGIWNLKLIWNWCVIVLVFAWLILNDCFNFFWYHLILIHGNKWKHFSPLYSWFVFDVDKGGEKDKRQNSKEKLSLFIHIIKIWDSHL